MKRPIKNINDPDFLEQLMGLGRGSAQKSYYPQLQGKIKELKQSELELKKLRNYLENVIDSMPSVLIGVDENLCVTHWNNAAEIYTQINSEDAVGREFVLIYPYKLLDTEHILDSIQTQQVQIISKHKDFRNGNRVYEDIVVYPLVSDDSRGAVIRIDDVTEKVKLEELMVQNEKMMSVGGLAAGMAHEINNPLAGMMQAAQVLHRRLASNKAANVEAAREAGVDIDVIWKYLESRKVFRQLEMINDSGIRIAKIIENMLSFSRKDNAPMGKYDISILFDKSIELAKNDYNLNEHYDFRHIKIDRDYEDNLPEIYCEASKIQQVFFNLLKNGAQAMFTNLKDDSLGRDPNFKIKIFTEEQWLVVEVADNGTGISALNLKKIFEPFFTTKKEGKGTGLGLSVSYFIITDTHKGIMTVDSELGIGTRFTIKLSL